MHNQALRVINITSDNPKERGEQHGESLRCEISEIAEIRLERMCNASHFKKPKDILDLAREHIAVLHKFDNNLYTELCSIASASNNNLERLIILNNYTDMRDIMPNNNNYNDEDIGGCSIIYTPFIVGQTWDIHASALPYVIALKFKDALLFSIAGCLGMAGININSVALAINNLSSIDARVGVIWPALVRKALTHTSARLACEEIMQAPNGSGRHFAIADMHDFFGIETSGTKKKIVWDKTDEHYFHTNHCLDPEMRATHIIRKDSTSLERFEYLDQKTRYEELKSPEHVFLALSHVSMPPEALMPHKTATCGTLVLDLANKSMLACQGVAHKELLSCPSMTISLAT